MFLLKLLGLKCNLILSTLNQLYTAVMKNCQAQKSPSSTFIAMIMKKNLHFSLPQVCGGVYFCRAGLFYCCSELTKS